MVQPKLREVELRASYEDGTELVSTVRCDSPELLDPISNLALQSIMLMTNLETIILSAKTLAGSFDRYWERS